MVSNPLGSLDWSATVSAPVGDRGVVHVLGFAEVAAVPRRMKDLLGASELRRFESFVRDEEAESYLRAHLALRLTVAEFTGCPPESLRLTARRCPVCGDRHGRPAIVGMPEVWLSLSHTQGWTMVGVSDRALGVDVEVIPTLATVDAIADRLHPAEQAYVRAAGDTRSRAFARVWCRKEAYLKALGVGLARDTRLDDTLASPARWEILDIGLPSPAAAAAVAFSVDTIGDC